MIAAAIMFAVCIVLIACTTGSADEIGTGTVRAADISLISAKTGLSEDMAEEIYMALLARGMSEGIKYVTEWTHDGETFYRVRTDGQVFDVYLSDGEIRIGAMPDMPSDDVKDETEAPETELLLPPVGDIPVVLNIKTKKYHTPDCRFVSKMSEANKLDIKVADVNDLHPLGYVPCRICGGIKTETETASTAE